VLTRLSDRGTLAAKKLQKTPATIAVIFFRENPTSGAPDCERAVPETLRIGYGLIVIRAADPDWLH